MASIVATGEVFLDLVRSWAPNGAACADATLRSDVMEKVQ
jgi:hypothetical protein